ncbi:MAG: acetyl-CoA C-acyltransferase FadI [Gammaproteobacteria bacterium]|jgi:acetyl-CoA acyltransferase|nr:acetyl-CoA C-acyltransferase FadI [Gammaproteobacteria bacterium]MBQ0773819.1 acetyl-CoA C-acyltransferase FadI [Gammaproteobacteria bacterium]|tara:strand:- start:12998 stop:14299 length:1302 start_codon:yes stop_codon:yes gene_type:complete
MAKKNILRNAAGRVAVIDGVRTPFARIATHFRDLNAIDLGAMVVSELLTRNNLKPQQIDQLVFGMTVMIPEAPFIAREIAIACGMDDVDAYSITRACATSFQTVASGAESILAGNAEIVIAGGTDSTTSVRIPMSKKFSSVMRDVNFAKTLGARLKLLSSLSAKDILPVAPSITEYSVGETMGESCEKMVQKWGVSRAQQDDIAYRSHVNAANAWKQGYLDQQVMTALLPNATQIKEDNLVRKNAQRAAYDALKPVYNQTTGSVTAGNASPLTDGASALILMSETKAKELGLTPIGYIRSYAFAAKTPKEDLLMGPVLAAPIALDRAGLDMKDITLFEMHEAFAGQLACNLKGLASDAYAKDVLHRSKAVGDVDLELLNVNGGSIAYGHPFGATGTRVINQALYELKRRGGGVALTTACAAGGIGAAMVVEAE